MGAKTSKEMLAARKLVEGGMRPAQAAKKSNITKEAIYMSPWYKELRKCRIAAQDSTVTK